MAAVELSLKNPLVTCFVFYATVCILKLIGVGLLTSYHRISKKIFANPEDIHLLKGKVNPNHPDVERSRRNHLNDMENIFPFVLIGIFYVMTGPALAAAKLHFQIFTVARFVHTFVYQMAIPQPSRAIAHLVSVATLVSMGYQVLLATMKAM